jgi:hypothetical protein
MTKKARSLVDEYILLVIDEPAITSVVTDTHTHIK